MKIPTILNNDELVLNVCHIFIYYSDIFSGPNILLMSMIELVLLKFASIKYDIARHMLSAKRTQSRRIMVEAAFL